LFILQVIYEHGGPRWNDDVDRGKLLTSPPEPSGSKQEEWAKEMRILPYKVFLFILASDFFTCCKIL
jgi:hypothetical protein